jgi:hypothetical protein
MVVLGFELRTLQLLGRQSTTQPTCQPFFCVEYFQSRAVCSELALILNPPDLCLLSS